MFSRRSPAAAAKWPQQLRLADYKNTPAASASAALLIGQLIDATDQHASRSNWCMCTTCVVGKPCGPLTSQTPIVGIGYWCSHDFQRDGTIPLPSQPFLHFPFRRFPPIFCKSSLVSKKCNLSKQIGTEQSKTHSAVWSENNASGSSSFYEILRRLYYKNCSCKLQGSLPFCWCIDS